MIPSRLIPLLASNDDVGEIAPAAVTVDYTQTCPNPFAGLIPDCFASNYNYAIATAISLHQRTCKLWFEKSLYVDCTSCSNTPIGRRGPNPFLGGGNGTYTNNCAVCGGAGKVPQLASTSVSLAVIWDYNKYDFLASTTVYPEGSVQTVSDISLISDINKSIYMDVNTDITAYGTQRFVLNGKPNPCGFGNDQFIICVWSPK